MKKHLLLMTTLAAVGSGAALADPQTATNSSKQSVEVIGHRTSPIYDPTQDLGSPGDRYPIERIVQVRNGGWANVEYGQNVEFVAQDPKGTERSFVWRFDGWPSDTVVHLDAFAPPEFVDYDVPVYIGRDPRYTGAGG